LRDFLGSSARGPEAGNARGTARDLCRSRADKYASVPYLQLRLEMALDKLAQPSLRPAAGGLPTGGAVVVRAYSLWFRLFVLPGLAASLAPVPLLRAQAPPVATWTANADLDRAQARTMPGLGAVQGVSFHDDKGFLYGDVWDANPRVGVLREYTRDHEATGRLVWPRRDGKPLIRHPAGPTWHARWGTFLGDTVKRKAVIPYPGSGRDRPRSPSRGFALASPRGRLTQLLWPLRPVPV
jgi:hypothetical protein